MAKSQLFNIKNVQNFRNDLISAMIDSDFLICLFLGLLAKMAPANYHGLKGGVFPLRPLRSPEIKTSNHWWNFQAKIIIPSSQKVFRFRRIR